MPAARIASTARVISIARDGTARSARAARDRNTHYSCLAGRAGTAFLLMSPLGGRYQRIQSAGAAHRAAG
jgi:hypothetical protein